MWKTTEVIPLPKKRPLGYVENDMKPVLLTPLVPKVSEGLVLNLVDQYVKPQIDEYQFGAISGSCIADAQSMA